MDLRQSCNNKTVFKSFLMGGFECASHYIHHDKRLDLTRVSAHDTNISADYWRIGELGVKTVRDGIRWHLIEKSPYHYDFSSVIPMLRAAHKAGIEIIWDLCHYGYPHDLNIFKPEFVHRFSSMARAFTQLLASETDSPPLIIPVNEISFFSWAGAEVAYLNPFVWKRGFELKKQLVRATLESIESIREISPDARIITTDPLINVLPDSSNRQVQLAAKNYHEWQYQALDMLTGRICNQLGGNEKYLDIVGVTYYPYNQWFYREDDCSNQCDSTIPPSHPAYRPLNQLLREIYDRYQRPVFIAETGAENDERVQWLRYISSEVNKAISNGVPVIGICWYPILDHPGWDDERHCHHGLWGYADNSGQREIYKPLLQEFRRQQKFLEI